ncbi:MAG: hypothetical protein AAF601_11500 [Pseudomonadota bacterium]
MSKVKQVWKSYLVQGDLPETMVVDTHLGAAPETLDGRHVVMLRLPYDAHGAGLPLSEDINAIDDAMQILTLVQNKLGLQEMGWRTGGGQRAVCWMAQAGQSQAVAQDAAEEVAHAAAQLWDGATCALAEHSADVIYREFLAPDPETWQFLQDGAVVGPVAEGAGRAAGMPEFAHDAGQRAARQGSLAIFWAAVTRKSRST